MPALDRIARRAGGVAIATAHLTIGRYTSAFVAAYHASSVVDLSMSLTDERAWLRCLSGYAGSGGGEWAGGETGSDDDYYFPSGGSDGDDCDAYD